ncbi:MAG: prepilin-type N-terminal cleavage/methylation domain-containing protein [Syntrophorhabdus sp.]
MRRIVVKNSRGFTIIELLVAMLVLFIGMMAMLDGLANYIRINMDNQMRNEAMRVTEATLETLRNSRFDDIQLHAVNIVSPAMRKVRNFDVAYTIVWTQTVLSPNSIAVQVQVSWTHRNITHQHEAASIISTI